MGQPGTDDATPSCDPLTVWRHHEPLLRAYVLGRSPTFADAEDVLQDVFVRMFSYCDRGRDCRDQRAFIYRVAHNRIVDHFRRRRQQQRLEADILTARQIDAAEGAVPDKAVEGAVARCARDLLRELPNHARQALELCVFDGLSQNEAAVRCSMSTPGMKSRVQRARRRLRRLLDRRCHIEVDRTGRILSCTPRAQIL